MKGEITITLMIQEHALRLTIPRAEEEKYRKAGKRINELFQKYSNRYGGGEIGWDKMILMTACHLSIEAQEAIQQSDLQPFVDEVAKINLHVAQYLQEVRE